jgi:hypothetical protein
MRKKNFIKLILLVFLYFTIPVFPVLLAFSDTLHESPDPANTNIPEVNISKTNVTKTDLTKTDLTKADLKSHLSDIDPLLKKNKLYDYYSPYNEQIISEQLNKYGYKKDNKELVESAHKASKNYGFSVYGRWLDQNEQSYENSDSNISSSIISDSNISDSNISGQNSLGSMFFNFEPEKEEQTYFKDSEKLIKNEFRNKIPAFKLNKNFQTGFIHHFLFPAQKDPLIDDLNIYLEGKIIEVSGQAEEFTSLDTGFTGIAAIDLYSPVKLYDNFLLTNDISLTITNDYLMNDKVFRIEKWNTSLATENLKFELGTLQPEFLEPMLMRDITGMGFKARLGRAAVDALYGAIIRPVEEVRFLRRTLGLKGKYEFNRNADIELSHIQTYDDQDSILLKNDLKENKNSLTGLSGKLITLNNRFTLKADLVGSSSRPDFHNSSDEFSDYYMLVTGKYEAAKALFKAEYLRSGPDFESYTGNHEQDIKRYRTSMDYLPHPSFIMSAGYSNERNNLDFRLTNTDELENPWVRVTLQPLNRRLYFDIARAGYTRTNTKMALFEEEIITESALRFNLWNTDIKTFFNIIDETDHIDHNDSNLTHLYGMQFQKALTSDFKLGLDFQYEEMEYTLLEKMDILRTANLDFIWDPSRETRYKLSYSRTDRRRVTDWFNYIKDNLTMKIDSSINPYSSLGLNLDTRHYQYKNQDSDYWEIIIKCFANIKF